MHECIKTMWADIINLLLAAGHSQKALADKVGVNQSTICRLVDGEGPEPRWSVGAALIAMAGGAEQLAQHGIDVKCYMSASAPPTTGYIDRRDPTRPNPYTGTDIDRRAAVAGES